MVYIDNFFAQYGRMKMCHMIADSEEELHQFAVKIGLKRKWFQNTNNPHYDVSISYRKKAVAYGAAEVTIKQAAIMCKIRRETGKLGTLEEADKILKGIK